VALGARQRGAWNGPMGQMGKWAGSLAEGRPIDLTPTRTASHTKAASSSWPLSINHY